MPCCVIAMLLSTNILQISMAQNYTMEICFLLITSTLRFTRLK